jgi:mono/diheme cytochrome c family protein
MLGASDILLQGKVLRGGMGTGMPEWGSLYSDADMWDVIAFLRSFVFDYGLVQ